MVEYKLTSGNEKMPSDNIQQMRSHTALQGNLKVLLHFSDSAGGQEKETASINN